MTDAHLTDDATLAHNLKAQAEAVLAMLPLITDDPTQQASVLIAAAAHVIEREVGSGFAPSAMMALIEPTIASWQR